MTWAWIDACFLRPSAWQESQQPNRRLHSFCEYSGRRGKPISNRYPAFFGNSEAPENIAEIIGNDLVRSGFFRLVSCDAATALDKDPDWKALSTAGVGAFADGSVTRAADGRYEIKFRLFDPVKKQETDEASYISRKMTCVFMPIRLQTEFLNA